MRIAEKLAPTANPDGRRAARGPSLSETLVDVTASKKSFAGARRLTRRILASVLPSAVSERAHAAFLGLWWLPRAGDADEPDLVVARSLLGPGDSAIDGGANFGRYADAFAEAVGPHGAVLAVEPVPRTA